MPQFLTQIISIKQKAVLGFLFIVLLISGIGLFFISGIVEESLENSFINDQRIIAREVIQQLEKEVLHHLEQAQIYSFDLAKEEALFESNRYFDSLTNPEAIIQERDSNWSADNSFTREILLNELSIELKEEFQVNDFYKEEYGFQFYPEVFVTNKYGVNVAQTSLTTDYFQADEEWWQIASNENGYISDVFFDQSADLYGMRIASPIFSEEGAFLGVFHVLLNFEAIIDELEDIDAAVEGFHEEENTADFKFDLVNGGGQILYSQLEQQNVLEPYQESVLSHLNQQDSAILNIDGQTRVFVKATSSGQNTFSVLGWQLLVSSNAENLFAPIKETRQRAFLMIGLFAVLTLILIYFFVKSLTGPLDLLAQKAQKIEQNNIDIKLPEKLLKRKDEIGVLANAFYDMTKRLRDLYDNLEEKVDEKTKKLKRRSRELAEANISIEREKVKDEAVLRSIGENLVVTDKEGRIEFVNTTFSETTGWTLEDVSGEKIDNVLPILDKSTEEKIPLEKQMLVKIKETKDRYSPNEVYKTQKKNGETFPISITGAPILLGEKMTGTVQVFRDITHEFEVDKAKTEFVSLASHQLRTPLSAIRWYTEMLLSGDAGELTKEQEQYLKEVYQGNKRMIALVNGLLNVSRLDLGTFVVEPKEVDVTKLAQEKVNELKQRADEKEITFKTLFDDTLPKITLDPQLTGIIFQNLLSNAVKYTEKGGIINFELSKKENNLLIQVEDNGIGIPDDQQGEIFTKLFRADNVKERDTDGTGLGLYLVKKILDHVGGSIRFDSTEGEGTTFIVTLPLSGMSPKKGTKSLEN